ncbi:MAG TPA: GGDEF domain-containing protein [Ktedonosporobacter sp.]|nr:GGDEF domain-containing protein [Ktedonosporobacter sp.]
MSNMRDEVNFTESQRLFDQIEFYRQNARLKEKAWGLLEEQIILAGQKQESIACILLDIDHFHLLVSSHGSEIGYLLLTKGLEGLQEVTSTKQIMSYGRDEFMAVIPAKGIEDAVFLAESVRQHLAKVILKTVTDRDIFPAFQIGCSAGVALYPYHANETMALLGKTEEGLYLAKRHGRNLTKLPSNESMVLKSNYYSQVQLERLAMLARKTKQTEASLLREALERLLSSNDI